MTLGEHRALEAGELWVDHDLYEAIVELCAWPRGRVRCGTEGGINA